MKALLFFWLALVSTIPAIGQHGCVVIMLNDGGIVHGRLLTVGYKTLLVQPDLTRVPPELTPDIDIEAIKKDAVLVPFKDIDSLVLERTSNAWITAFGITTVATFLIGSLIAGSTAESHSDSWVSGLEGVERIGEAAPYVGFLAATIGTVAALIVHNNAGSDLTFSHIGVDDTLELEQYALLHGYRPAITASP